MIRSTIFILAMLSSSCTSPARSQDVTDHPHAIAIDGDTFIDTRAPHHVRYRLTLIDAPEMPGHCRRGRQCAAGDPYAARAALQALLDRGTVRCITLKIDYYGRPLVDCHVGNLDISNAMLANGTVKVYRYSRKGRL